MKQSRPKAGRFVLSGGRIFPLDGSDAFPGDLYVEDGRILAVAPVDPPPTGEGSGAAGGFARVDCHGSWILPGFVQTHVHLCQTLLRGAAERRTLFRWLSEIVWPFEAALDAQTLEVSAEWGIHQLLAGGVTTVLDMGTTHDTDVVARAAARAGIRALLGPAGMDRGPDASRELLRPGPRFQAEVESLAARWQGYDNGRLGVALCPRFIPSVSEPLWKEMLARPEFGAFPVHTHGSETPEEVEEVVRLTGRTPGEYFASLDPAPGRLKVAHGVWMNDADRLALRRIDAALLHCPSSNLKLGSGVADVAAFREAGISVGLGVDGAACNNRLDPWHEMRLAALIQSHLRGPESVDAGAILRMATLGGAEALGLGGVTGSLVRGKRADLVVLDPAADSATFPGELELETPETLLVFAGSPAMVRETWVEGRRVHDAESDAAWRRAWGTRVLEARRTLAARAGQPQPPPPRAGSEGPAGAPSPNLGGEAGPPSGGRDRPGEQ